MATIDIIILIIIGAGAIVGFMKGFIRQLASILGLIVGLLAAKALYTTLAEKLCPTVTDSMTVAQVLAFIIIWIAVPLIFSKDRKKVRERVAAALEEVGMKEYISKKANQLSGGQKQRVAIARAIVNNPRYILADEPTGALDTETSRQVMDTLIELNRKGTTIIVITHDPDIAALCTRSVRIEDGRVVD